MWDSKAYLSSAPLPTKTTWDLTGDITISPISSYCLMWDGVPPRPAAFYPCRLGQAHKGGKLHSTLPTLEGRPQATQATYISLTACHRGAHCVTLPTSMHPPSSTRTRAAAGKTPCQTPVRIPEADGWVDSSPDNYGSALGEDCVQGPRPTIQLSQPLRGSHN